MLKETRTFDALCVRTSRRWKTNDRSCRALKILTLNARLHTRFASLASGLPGGWLPALLKRMTLGGTPEGQAHANEDS